MLEVSKERWKLLKRLLNRELQKLIDFQDTCQGDSGAPIQVSHSDAACVYDIIGLTSYGPPGCGSKNQYSVYTKTMHYLDWIEGIVWPESKVNASLPEEATSLPETTTLPDATTLPETTTVKKPRYVKNGDWNRK